MTAKSEVQGSRPEMPCVKCGLSISFDRALIFGVCVPCWNAAAEAVGADHRKAEEA